MHETVASAPLASAPEGALVARIIDGEDRGLAIVIEDTVLVGTSDACELKLRDPTVSRRHASLSPGAVGVVVRDAGSKNGVWVGAVAVREADVPVGTEVRVGSTLLRIEATVTASPRGAAPQLRTGFGRFVGEAPSLQRVYAQLERAAPSDTTILVEGESGTGKELLAEAIHDHSARRSGPFVIVDCGTMQETLVESELFGHEKGAFTGADRKHIGAFEAAQGGTVFLDEIGELPLSLQTRLLRVLEQRHIRRVGGTARLPIDVRVIGATNRNLDKEVDEGRFRLDLFHRLAVVLVRVPPLRERRGDLDRLARHFARQLGHDDALTPAVLERIARHDWPGNVRELRNYVERVTLLGDAADAIPASSGESGFEAAATSGLPYRAARARALDAFTDAYVASMLAAHGGNVSAAARAAGIARRYFQRLKG